MGLCLAGLPSLDLLSLASWEYNFTGFPTIRAGCFSFSSCCCVCGARLDTTGFLFDELAVLLLLAKLLGFCFEHDNFGFCTLVGAWVAFPIVIVNGLWDVWREQRK